MPDGLVFYLAVLFSEQFALLLAPVEWDAFAQPQDGQRRRDVARHDARHDLGRKHREAQRPRNACVIILLISPGRGISSMLIDGKMIHAPESGWSDASGATYVSCCGCNLSCTKYIRLMIFET